MLPVSVVLLEGLLLAHLVDTTSHRALVVGVLLLLAHGLGCSEGNALACHLTLLLSGSTTLHEETLHDLPITRVDEPTAAMTR